VRFDEVGTGPVGFDVIWSGTADKVRSGAVWLGRERFGAVGSDMARHGRLGGMRFDGAGFDLVWTGAD